VSDRHILPPNATRFEIALDRTENRILAIPVPVEDLWRPETCPAHLLGYLAWALSVDLWEDDWSVARKRRMCADAIALHQLKGTYEGLKRYLAYVDAQIIQAVMPPQRIFAMSYDPERRAAFRSSFQQLRVYPFRLRTQGQWFAGSVGHSYVGYTTVAYANAAMNHYGRRAVIWDQGVETPVRWTADRLPDSSGTATTLERIVVPTRLGPTDAFVGRVYPGGLYARSAGPRSRILALGNDLIFNADAKPEIAQSSGGLGVVSTTPERVQGLGPLRGRAAHAGMTIVGRSTARRNEAPHKIFDRYYLMNEGRVSRTQGVAFGPFVGQMRVSLAPFSARFRIRRASEARKGSMLVGHCSAGNNFARTQVDRYGPIIRAMRAAGMYRDTLHFTTRTRRPPTFSDGIPFASGGSFDSIIDIRRDPL